MRDDRNRRPSQEAEPDGLIEGRNAVIEALRAGTAIDKIYIARGETDATLGHIASTARNKGVVVTEADRRKLDGMSRTKSHQGVIAVAAVREYASVEDILNAARDLQLQRVMVTSTSEVYGTAQYVPIDEKHPYQGQSPYSATKIGADRLAESYFRSFGLPVTIVRPFNTYGPRQSSRAVIPTVISQLLAGHDEIHLGSLTPTRDFVFCKDTARGFIELSRCGAAIWPRGQHRHRPRDLRRGAGTKADRPHPPGGQNRLRGAAPASGGK